ncbi:MAG: PEGA domain-containing protein [Candidatus Atribacteria bacterium]|nr:PEGA domain-containing protein [Candidatus Atribacteria bacterium]
MSKNVFFLKRSKILVCVFTTLLIFLCLAIIGVSYAQSVEETEKMKSIQIINPHPEFSLRLWLDKERGATYAPGEKIKIFFQVSRDSFVILYSYDTGGRGKPIFPNQYSPHNLVRAGEVNTFEGQIDPSTQPGIEYVLGFATTRPIPAGLIPELNNDYKAFTRQLKGIIQPLPSTDWATSNLLSYTITPIIPPPNYGRIIAMSNPQGAKVYLDNVYKGLTPLNLNNITSDQHSIKLVLSGYQEWNSYVSVFPWQSTTVSADLIAQQQSYGTISVYSNPKGAKVYLDNSSKGLTPLNLKNITLGQHSIKLVLSGYQEWNSYVSVFPSQTTTVSADLIAEQSYGSISISCNQSGAKIFLDGTYKKTTFSSNPVALENVQDGYHELTIIKDGFKTWVEDIWVYFGEISSVDITMTKL